MSAGGKKLYIALGIVALVAAGAWWMFKHDSTPAVTYRLAPVLQGDIQSTVAATGTLNAVTTVQVGTQVSGQVSAIYVDFNDKVKKDQLLARIDPTLAEQAVADALASVQRSQAQADLAQQQLTQEKQLHDGKNVSDAEYQTAVTAAAVAASDLASARIALDKARKNLSYTSIKAPIDGVIVERDVDVGQTVAASLSAPQLFLIANDLAQMQILASVDESDIGVIKEGLPATFTVPSYPARVFTGVVKQVRLQSKTTDNVVNYTTVIAVGNPDRVLLPGMTATVSFITGSATNVRTVPNAAIRFHPTAAMMETPPGASGGSTATRTRGPRRDSTGTTRAGRPDSARGTRPTRATVWQVGPDGKLVGTVVATGITDGQRTVILGDALPVGAQVVIGANLPGAASTPTPAATNPLQPQRTPGGGGRRPGGP